MWLKLNFPDYNKLKELPQNKEYKFRIFEVYETFYCRFTYNEDFSGKFKADLMCNGYSDTYEPSDFRKWFDNTEKDYNTMCCNIERLYNQIVEEILNNNNNMDWFYNVGDWRHV